MAIIETRGLSKTYGQGPVLVEALKPLDLVIEQGEFVCVMGKSGSGKSTLLHLLGGLETPTAGEVIIEGLSLYSQKEQQRTVFRRRRMGYIFQFFNLVQELTALSNILLPLTLDGQRPDTGYVNELVDTLGLGHRLDFLPGQLSGGEQQRVAIARALANKPAVVLCDEPTGNLDDKTSEQILDLLKLTQRRYSQTLVLVTHERAIAESAGRLITLADGQIARDTAGDLR